MTVLRLRGCPFCGATHVTYDRWVVCQAAHAVLTPDGADHRRLSLAVLDTLIGLLVRRGKPSTARDLFLALYEEDEEPEYAHSVVQTHVRTLRVRGVVKIDGRQGRGWEIVH